MDEYISALATELGIRGRSAPPPHLDTVYLGGGTPSRLGPDGIEQLAALVATHFSRDDSSEFTIEANPDDVSAKAASRWKNAGINRVSLGVQSFDDTVLAWMHRTHDAGQASRAVAILRDAGFENISVDLIFALPASLRRSWERDLSLALEMAPDHISLYGLTVERGTPLARWTERGSVLPAAENDYASDFLLAHAMTSASGFEHYEVSNFAQPGRRSLHNSAYWSGASYLGVGPSAHSFDGVSRTWNVPHYAEWLERLAAEQPVTGGTEVLTPENKLAERVYLGLRTDSGLAVSAGDLDAARLWAGEGWATIRDDAVVNLTPEGWLRLDSLAATLTGL